ncbi:anaphase-promoting complex subunit 15B isoform X2 [Atheta coriaria]
MAVPLFPKLMPKLIDSEWLNVDQPCDDESEVSQLEREHQAWLLSIQQRNMDLLPIGKTQAENLDEEEEEDDEDDNDDDDESETHDEEDEDEIEVDVTERNSPVDVNIRMGQGHG